jgi:uncharacterized membrane protein
VEDTPLEQAKHPRAALAGPYGHPFHPILVTVPIGAWIAGLVFDLAAVFGDNDSAFLEGAQWLIGIGIVGAVVAAVFGLMDFGTLTKGTAAHRTGQIHLTLNLTVVVLFVLSFIVRAAGGLDDVSVWGMVLSILGLAILSVSGWLGGKLVFHYGVRVAREDTQREGFR